MLPKIKLNNRIISFRIREDRATLLVCMLISLIFWILISMSKKYESIVYFNLNFAVREGYVLKELPPNPLTFEVVGRGWDLFSFFLTNNHFNLNLNAEDSKELTESYILGLLQKNIGQTDLLLQKLSLNSFRVVLEKKSKKLISSASIPEINLAQGFSLKKLPYFEPEFIEISGPESVIQNINHWTFQDIEIQNLNSTSEFKVNINSLPPEVKSSHKELKLIVEVEELVEKSFFVPVQIKGGNHEHNKIFPQKVHLTCAVGASRYQEVQPNLFDLFIELDTLGSDDRELMPITIGELPYWIQNVKFSPESVRFFSYK